MRTSTPAGRSTDELLWPRVVRELADDLAVDALSRDRAGKPPYDEVARLQEAGLPALLTPPGRGARPQGAGLRTACATVAELAAADSSVAELLARHYVLSWSARFFGTPEDAERFEPCTTGQGWLLGGGVDLPDPESVPDLTLTAADGGHVVRGCRTLEAGATVADRLVVGARSAGTGDLLVVVVDPTHPGVTTTAADDRLGQRLTGAGTVAFDDVPVDAAHIVGTVPRDEHAVAPFTGLAPLMLRLLLCHTVLGTAEGALAEARDFSRASHAVRRPDTAGRPDGAPRNADPYLLLAYGESATEAHAASAVVERATEALADGLRAGMELCAAERADIAALVAAAEAVTARAAVRITTRIVRFLPGTDPVHGDPGLDRFWRNTHVLTAHHSPAHSLRDIGDHYLNGTLPRLAGRH